VKMSPERRPRPPTYGDHEVSATHRLPTKTRHAICGAVVVATLLQRSRMPQVLCAEVCENIWQRT